MGGGGLRGGMKRGLVGRGWVALSTPTPHPHLHTQQHPTKPRDTMTLETIVPREGDNSAAQCRVFAGTGSAQPASQEHRDAFPPLPLKILPHNASDNRFMQ